MRAKCAAHGCKSATYNKFGYILSFHRFPKDPERQQQWKDFSKNPQVMNKSYKGLWLCGSHFEKSCYYANNALKSNATPTISVPEAGTSFIEISNQTDGDSNCSSIAADVDGEGSRDAKHLPNECIEIIATTDDEDDCKSVNFSSNEDEDPDGEAKMDWEKEGVCSENVKTEPGEIQYSTGLDSNHYPQPGTYTVSAPVEVFTKLPSVSPSLKPQTSPQHPGSRQASKSLFKRSVIDKAEEVNIDIEEEVDDCSTFAAHVKIRMRNFSHAQKIIAQKLISDVMFMADTRQLKLDSAVINPQALASTSQVSNGVPKKTTGGSFSAYIDSDNEDCPSAKRPK